MKNMTVVVFSVTAVLAVTTPAHAASAEKQSNAGDSISQGFCANGWLGDHPDLSWVQGTADSISSIYSRYRRAYASFAQEPVSVSGAELVGGGDNFAAQAARICAQRIKPTRVSVLLGSNDVCNRPGSATGDAADNLYTEGTWTQALRAGMDQLAACLPSGAIVQVLSVPRVDFLYDAGTAKSPWCSFGVWPLANVCRVVTGERNPARRAQIGARIDAYNDITHRETAEYTSNVNGRNENGVIFMSDWKGSIANGQEGTSVGTFRFTAEDINGVDCFHPNSAGQRRIACTAWEAGPEGAGNVASCLEGGAK